MPFWTATDFPPTGVVGLFMYPGSSLEGRPPTQPVTPINACCRLISYIYPARNEGLLKALQQKQMTVVGELPAHPWMISCRCS